MNEFYNPVILVFEFNVWGMPGGIGDCQYKKERMKALANIIRSREPYFDIFMMAELWMEDDHALLQGDSFKRVTFVLIQYPHFEMCILEIFTSSGHI